MHITLNIGLAVSNNYVDGRVADLPYEYVKKLLNTSHRQTNADWAVAKRDRKNCSSEL